MGYEGLKLELIEWLAKLEDGETIQYLKVVKDSKPDDQNWWDDLDEAQKKGIEMGLKDIDEGRVTPHDEVRNKYGS
ncbi:MAG: hypothetical protein ACFCUM_12430 [Bacteroidales bacterium]